MCLHEGVLEILIMAEIYINVCLTWTPRAWVTQGWKCGLSMQEALGSIPSTHILHNECSKENYYLLDFLSYNALTVNPHNASILSCFSCSCRETPGTVGNLRAVLSMLLYLHRRLQTDLGISLFCWTGLNVASILVLFNSPIYTTFNKELLAVKCIFVMNKCVFCRYFLCL